MIGCGQWAGPEPHTEAGVATQERNFRGSKELGEGLHSGTSSSDLIPTLNIGTGGGGEGAAGGKLMRKVESEK